MAIIENAITLLKKDHLEVRGIFKLLKAADKLMPEKRQALFKTLKFELDLHAEIEETIFYPAIREIDAELEELVEDSYQDHMEVRDMLEELEKNKTSPEWVAKLDGLEESVNQHVEIEESDVFKRVEQALSKEQLQELGKLILQLKEKRKAVN